MQRLGPQDSMMIASEAAGWRMLTGSAMILKPRTGQVLDLAWLRNFYAARMPHLPIYRQRLVTVPGALGRPVWVEVDNVDLDEHITEIVLPVPGTDQQLAEVIGEQFAIPLDMAKPLWKVILVRGLESGQVAMLSLVHHALSDGVRGQQMQAALFDANPDAPLQRPGEVPGVGRGVPGALNLLGGAAAEMATLPLRLVRTGLVLGIAAGKTVRIYASGANAGLAGAAPRVRFNEEVGERRNFAFASLPLAPVKAWAKTHGGTVNDAVLTMVGGALRRHLGDLGELPESSLVACIPVGHVDGVAPGQVGGNSFSVMTASLATDVAEPVERMKRITESTRAGKALSAAMGKDLMTDVVDVPPVIITMLGKGFSRLGLNRYQPPQQNVTVSNIRGSQTAMYLGGAELVAGYPIGPVADGLGLNITLLSYRDAIDVGITSSPEIIDDLWAVMDALRDELDSLNDVVAPTKGTS